MYCNCMQTLTLILNQTNLAQSDSTHTKSVFVCQKLNRYHLELVQN